MYEAYVNFTKRIRFLNSLKGKICEIINFMPIFFSKSLGNQTLKYVVNFNVLPCCHGKTI